MDGVGDVAAGAATGWEATLTCAAEGEGFVAVSSARVNTVAITIKQTQMSAAESRFFMANLSSKQIAIMSRYEIATIRPLADYGCAAGWLCEFIRNSTFCPPTSSTTRSRVISTALIWTSPFPALRVTVLFSVRSLSLTIAEGFVAW